ncbi:MAG: VWA domain-containing protein [Pseudomonadota bacterium]
MPDFPTPDAPRNGEAAPGRLPDNIAHFARALRKAGLPVGPGRILEATRAVEALGLGSKADFYWALHACFVSRPEHRAAFAAAFKLFWRDPQVMERMLAALLSETTVPREEKPKQAADTRAREALTADQPPPAPPQSAERDERIELDATFAFSADEKLRRTDFEQMTTAEIEAAKAALARLRLPAPKLISRRSRPALRGRAPDWRATIRASFRHGGQPFDLRRRAARPRRPSLIVLADISGSMSGYSRMLLHFLHGLTNRARLGTARAGEESWARVESFVFGTRLTRITRHLAARDVDDALTGAGREAQDWEGGTRIGACLETFNTLWSRRVLGPGAVVLLVTDGLDRDDPERLARAAERLRLSCRRLIWLNPLLRWDGFSAQAGGVKALLPQVDSFRAVHNIDSLDALAAALSGGEDGGEKARLLAAMAAAGAHEQAKSGER